jgi:hypothetical protein
VKRAVIIERVFKAEDLKITDQEATKHFLQIAMAHDYSLYEPSLEGISPHALLDSDYEYGNIVAVPDEKREEFESAFQHDLK